MVKMDMSFYLELGKILKKARENRRISLDQLSENLNGLKKKSTLKRYEDGESRVDMDTLASICDVLNLDMAETVKLAGARADFSDFIDHNSTVFVKEESAAYETDEKQAFTNVDDAMLYIIENPTVAAYGGYDLDRMTDEEKIEFANQIADTIKFFGQKYNK